MASSASVVLNQRIEHQPASAFRAKTNPAALDLLNVVWVCIGLILMALGFVASGIADLLNTPTRSSYAGTRFRG